MSSTEFLSKPNFPFLTAVALCSYHCGMELGANKKAGLEVRAGKAENICLHYHQHAGTN
jgi:hypothetical protein